MLMQTEQMLFARERFPMAVNSLTDTIMMIPLRRFRKVPKTAKETARKKYIVTEKL